MALSNTFTMTTEQMQELPDLKMGDLLKQIMDAKNLINETFAFSRSVLQPVNDKPTATEILYRMEAAEILYRMEAAGPQVHETLAATEPAEDWSRVRSPGRAARRRHKHRQNIRVWRKPCAFMLDGKLYVHPEIMRTMRQNMAKRIDGSVRFGMVQDPNKW